MVMHKKASIWEIIGAFLPLFAMVVVFSVLIVLGNRWAIRHKAANDAKSKARIQELMNRPASSNPRNYSSSSTSDYVESRGTDDCTSDCSGHDAGYEYAEENDICDTEYSDSHSDSFNEGVVAWSEDNC